MQKVGIIVQILAGRFISVQIGERIPTVEEFTREYEVSRGTIQTALTLLQEDRAISFQPRGHMGTFVKAINRPKLLELSGIKTVVGVMPLPYSKKYEGLATGLYTALQEKGLSAALAFMHGSNYRLNGLLEDRYDFAVMSFLTAKYYIDRGEPIEILENFGRYTYVGKHVLLLRDDFQGDYENCRVGIDHSSVDQKTLTQQFFAEKNVEYVPLIYSQIVPFLSIGKIDAAVWNLDDIDLAGNHLRYEPLDEKGINIVDTEAVLVCKKDNLRISQIIQELLEKDRVLEIQKDVIDGKVLPKY
ncbi:hypothetical protein A7X67_03870 [Clostridium sp. W14A]|nr:hypothetical protein A7X67_03870 [Clostridium sp. W14A]